MLRVVVLLADVKAQGYSRVTFCKPENTLRDADFRWQIAGKANFVYREEATKNPSCSVERSRLWTNKKMLRRNFRLVEAVGMLLVLFAWGLNWVSIERWAEAQSSLETDVERVAQAHQNAQITANTMLESAVVRADRSAGVHDAVPDLQPYQREWDSADVRRAWLMRAANAKMAVTLLIVALINSDQQYSLGFQAKIHDLTDAFVPIRDRVEALAGDRKGWVPAISFNKDALSADDAQRVEFALAQLAERAFVVDSELRNTIAAKRKRSTMIYSAIFFLGTVMLIAAKLLNWQVERRAKP